MADRLQTHINRVAPLARKRDLVVLAGYFEPKGSSTPTVINIPGVTSITHSATGVWLVTLDASYADVSVVASLQLHDPTTDVAICLGDFTAGTGSVGSKFLVQANKISDQTAVDITNVAGVAGNRIHLFITAAIKSGFSSIN